MSLRDKAGLNWISVLSLLGVGVLGILIYQWAFGGSEWREQVVELIASVLLGVVPFLVLYFLFARWLYPIEDFSNKEKRLEELEGFSARGVYSGLHVEISEKKDAGIQTIDFLVSRIDDIETINVRPTIREFSYAEEAANLLSDSAALVWETKNHKGVPTRKAYFQGDKKSDVIHFASFKSGDPWFRLETDSNPERTFAGKKYVVRVEIHGLRIEKPTYPIQIRGTLTFSPNEGLAFEARKIIESYEQYRKEQYG